MTPEAQLVHQTAQLSKPTNGYNADPVSFITWTHNILPQGWNNKRKKKLKGKEKNY